jgi:hypothetical protein
MTVQANSSVWRSKAFICFIYPSIQNGVGFGLGFAQSDILLALTCGYTVGRITTNHDLNPLFRVSVHTLRSKHVQL